MASSPPLLSLADLRVQYSSRVRAAGLRSQHLRVNAVDGVSLEVEEGKTAALVGESGSGKSTLGLATLRLLEPCGGRVLFAGRDVLGFGAKELRAFRREAQIVFQDPHSSLHPTKRIETILAEPLVLHTKLSRVERRRNVHRLLGDVGLPGSYAGRRASELSGGQRQRVAIARALALRPRLVILDEPVSALDVSIRAQIIQLLRELQSELNLTYLFISHDLALVRSFCDSVTVMYLGKVVESGSVDRVFSSPAHPYTHTLLSATPIPDPELERRRERLPVVGEVGSAANPPAGCRFHPRCTWCVPVCREREPALDEHRPGMRAACHRWEEVVAGASSPEESLGVDDAARARNAS